MSSMQDFSNVIEALRSRADEHADRVAVVDAGRQVTHAELWSRVDRLSNAFIAAGLRKGDRLLAWLPNVPEAIETELACLQAGGVWVTLNVALTWAEVSSVIESTEPAVAVIGAGLLHKIPAQGLGSSMRVFVVGDAPNAPDGAINYESALGSAAANRPDIEIGPDDLLRLRYTSGTTGRMKAAMLAHRTYLASLEILLDELPPLSPSDRVLHAAPLTHASAAYMYPVLYAGGANVLMGKFEADAALELIERERVSIFFAVPTMLHRFAESPVFQTRDLSSLRSVSYGAAPTPPEVLAPVVERLPRKPLHIYGLTEALHPVTTLAREEHYPGNPRLGSVGKPTCLCEVRVVRDDGTHADDGEVGELWVRAPVAMDGYWRAPGDTAEVMRDGWIVTGDVGYCDADGYFWIVDRKKDVIISGGFNVYTAEVEAVLLSHPAIAEAAVIGLPHADWGEEVHAVVSFNPGAGVDESELFAYCRDRLAGYKTPKGVTVMDALPRNSTGKILKRDLPSIIANGPATSSRGEP
jgi:acyl-CoA synthetase (AMP-forming)/AMP-acid ligase II